MKHLIPLALAAWLGTLAFTTFDYWVYPLTRWAVAIAAGCYALAFEERCKAFSWVLALTALVFNPLIPLRLGRDAWQWADGAAALVFLGCAPVLAGLPAWFGRHWPTLMAFGLIIGAGAFINFAVHSGAPAPSSSSPSHAPSPSPQEKAALREREQKRLAEEWEKNRHRFER